MKNKIIKTSIILMLIITMTMVTPIFVGKTLISYAVDDVSTNIKNIEFGTDIEGNSLKLHIGVKQDGYLNGQIELGKANFKISKEAQINENINKIEGNKITLNQINAGSSVEIEIPVELKHEEIFDLGLLNMESEIILKGTYKNSTEKDITVNATKKVQISYPEANLNEENILSEAEIITNKEMTINGEKRKVVQIALKVGLKDNRYPIKSINLENIAPKTKDGSAIEISQIINLNTMTESKVNVEDTKTSIEMTNAEKQESVLWKKQGNEEIILTYIAKPEVTFESQEINTTGKITLYDGKEIEIKSKAIYNADEEKDSSLKVNVSNAETQIYKGKIYNGIDREISTKTTVDVNIGNVYEYLEIREDNVFGETIANVQYKSIKLNKEKWFKVLGENGTITISNKSGNAVATIDKNSQANEMGDVEINYENPQEGIVIKTTEAVATGKLELTHSKIIKNNTNLPLNTYNKFSTIVYVTNNIKVEKNDVSVELKEPQTQASISVNQESMSTVIKNNIQLTTTLKSKTEQYDLYKNPTIAIEMPEDVETIEISKVQLLYEDELKVKTYNVQNRVINIILEGEQTNYTEGAIEGPTVIIDAKVTLNKKSATKDSQIKMSVKNEKTNMIANASTPIKVIAPTEVTTIYNIDALGVATMAKEETAKVKLPISAEAKEAEAHMEIINNKPVTINNVEIIGTLPTASSTNTIDTSITQEIQLQGVENAKIYYTENENATQDTENAWTENLETLSNAKKYLIKIDSMETQSSVVATYEYQIPAGLEYNETMKQWYETSYTDSQTSAQNTMKSTVVEATTGVGPIVEASLSAKVGTQQLSSGDKVKAGEVIKYQVEVSNTGSEEVQNAKITAPVPEGTTLIKAKENYEYTGSSYYVEVQQSNYEETISSMKPGEKVTVEYEVRVNKDITAGKEIKNSVQLNYGEVTKTTNEVTYIAELGDIRVSIKRITDRDTELYEGGVVQYFAIIENTSNEEKKNVGIQTNLPKSYTVEQLILLTGLEDEDVTDKDLHASSEITPDVEEKEITDEELSKNIVEEITLQTQKLEYSENISIGTLQPGEVKVLSYDIAIGKDIANAEFSTIVKQGNNSYRSNVWTDVINSFDISVEMSSNIIDQYVEAGNVLEYNITVKNNSNSKTNGLTITDNIPLQLTITEITKNQEKLELPKGNNVEISIELNALEQASIKIKTLVNQDEEREKPETIANKAEAKVFGETVSTSAEQTHIINPNYVPEKDPDEETEQNPQEKPNEDNNIEDNNVATGNKLISGIAWYDENADGKKDNNEKTLKGIKVKLLNAETNKLVKDKDGKILQVETDDKGIYIFNNIGNGKYIAIFEYDTNQYAVTKYEVEGATEAQNSNVTMNNLQIEGQTTKSASTDIIEIKDNNISNINIGLIKLQNFDMKLEKYVSKIIIQNSQGTIIKEYTDETLAKIDLDAKLLNGTMAIIEYKIKVTNNGEVPGYVKKIADYAPSDLKFNSELNRDWYQSGNTLYSTSLANTKIEAGEQKILTLTLTKTLTENNIGRVNNTAEIVESYNELELPDSNSTSGNKVPGENDTGVADTILSIKTGGAVIYTYVTGIAIAILAGTVVFLQNRRMKKSQKARKLDKIS